MAFQDIKVEYRFESEDMTDEEYKDQDEQTFIITQDMIYELVRQNIILPNGKEICQENFYYNMVKCKKLCCSIGMS